MGKIIAVVNQKGGVAKTTTAINLADGLYRRKRKVLLVDLDPQGNATSGLGVDREKTDKNLYDLFQNATYDDAALQVVKEKGLFLLPSSIDLAGIEMEFAENRDRATRLKRILKPIRKEYDYILIDCPPSLGLLTINALVAAKEVLVPIQCEYYALEGVSQLMDTISVVNKSLNPKLKLGRIVLTMYDGRMRLSNQVVNDVRNAFGDVVAKTLIPRNVRLSEAPGYGVSIFDYEPLSKGAFAYKNLAREVDKG